MLRTEEGSRRHSGLSWVICDMHAPGIDIRPIRKMSGQVEFAQVFYDDVRIPLSNVVGGLGNGWKVAMSTLGFERGTGFIADQVKQSQEIEDLIGRARANGMIRDHRIAHDLAQMRAEVAALRAMTYRNISIVVRTGQPGAEASLIRLFTAELGQRLDRMAVALMGPEMLDFTYGEDNAVGDYLRGFAEHHRGRQRADPARYHRRAAARPSQVAMIAQRASRPGAGRGPGTKDVPWT